jgi:hypothetical protein
MEAPISAFQNRLPGDEDHHAGRAPVHRFGLLTGRLRKYSGTTPAPSAHIPYDTARTPQCQCVAKGRYHAIHAMERHTHTSLYNLDHKPAAWTVRRGCFKQEPQLSRGRLGIPRSMGHTVMRIIARSGCSRVDDTAPFQKEPGRAHNGA